MNKILLTTLTTLLILGLGYVSSLESVWSYVAEAKEIILIDDILEKIAECESNGQHYKDGKVLRGEKDPRDIGKWQINTRFWLKEAQAKGIDIFNEKGNKKMARYIYHKQGVGAWSKSYDSENRRCWKDYER